MSNSSCGRIGLVVSDRCCSSSELSRFVADGASGPWGGSGGSTRGFAASMADEVWARMIAAAYLSTPDDPERLRAEAYLANV